MSDYKKYDGMTAVSLLYLYSSVILFYLKWTRSLWGSPLTLLAAVCVISVSRKEKMAEEAPHGKRWVIYTVLAFLIILA